jgi:hypothetical protein
MKNNYTTKAGHQFNLIDSTISFGFSLNKRKTTYVFSKEDYIYNIEVRNDSATSDVDA